MRIERKNSCAAGKLRVLSRDERLMAFNVAVLEDDAEFREAILVPELSALGFDVEGFATSVDLERRMLSKSFDVLVLDVGLSGEHGLDVARRLRARSATIGIIILTGRGIQEEQVAGLRESIDAWLAKPIDMDVLAATLISVVRRLRAGAGDAMPSAEANEWRITANGWQLVAPQGQQLDLNLAERLLLSRLFRTPRETVARDELIACIASTPEEFDPHRLEMLVHRLRRRVLERLGESLPVRAIRGSGYMALVRVALNGRDDDSSIENPGCSVVETIVDN